MTTKGTRRAEGRRAARKKINAGIDPNVQVRHGYGGSIEVSHADKQPDILLSPVGDEHYISKPIYNVADIIINALGSNAIELDTVTGSQSIEFHIKHEGRKIHFFMQYDDEQ